MSKLSSGFENEFFELFCSPVAWNKLDRVFCTYKSWERLGGSIDIACQAESVNGSASSKQLYFHGYGQLVSTELSCLINLLSSRFCC